MNRMNLGELREMTRDLDDGVNLYVINPADYTIAYGAVVSVEHDGSIGGGPLGPFAIFLRPEEAPLGTAQVLRIAVKEPPDVEE